MTEDELLQRLSQTLRKEIGPAIEIEYPKTQAFMASVVTQKLGRQVGLARAHETAEAADFSSLVTDLQELTKSTSNVKKLSDAIVAFDRARTKVELCQVIDALYSERAEIGEAPFSSLLARVRVCLRSSIDRQMEYAA
ncbi:MAG: hypothetical protein ACI9BW_002620 [Gammaproteobacteria bacterium]|jgi:hypothetical protein